MTSNSTINVNGTPVTASELLSDAHRGWQAYDEAYAEAKATVKHGLVRRLLLARRDETTGQAEPLTRFDREHLEAVSVTALNIADVDLMTDIASDAAGQAASECLAEQIYDGRLIARRAIALFLELSADGAR